jgi:hypothetical protein
MQKAVKDFSDFYGLLDQLIAGESPPPLEADDITVMRLAERAKCGNHKAKSMVVKWAASGVVEYIGKRREPRGHAIDAWRLKKGA